MESKITSPHKRPLIVSMAFLFSFTPFFSFYPIQTDLQPIYLIIMGVILLANRKYLTKLSMPSFLLLVFSIISFVYIDPNYFEIIIRQSAGIIAAFLAYTFYSKYSYYLDQKLLFLIILINFIPVFIDYYNPEFFEKILGSFVRVAKSAEGGRGAAGFSSEPGFIGALGVFYILTSYFLKVKRGDTRYYFINIFLSLIIVYMSKSGTGIMYLLIFIFFVFFKIKAKNLISLLCVILLIFLVIEYVDLGRGGSILKGIFDNTYAIMTTDLSISHRVINIITGILSPFEFPFGVGVGGYDRAFVEINSIYNITDTFPGKVSNISAFALYSVEFGIIYLGLMAYFITKSASEVRKGGFKYLVVALLFCSSSFSVAFPPVWFIFSILHKPISKNYSQSKLAGVR